MKYLQVIVIAILITACSGTKHAVKDAPVSTQTKIQTTKKNNTVEVVKDVVPKQEVTLAPKVVKQDVIALPKVIEKPKVVVAPPIIDKPIKTVVPKATPQVVEAPKVIKKVAATKIPLSHSSWDALLQKHVSNAGNVNYKGFKKDNRQLQNYIKLLGTNLPSSKASKNDKLVYWINAYNALTIDLILRNYPIASIKDIKDPWGKRYWKLGDKWRNLNEIEHQILRKMDEPRVHFAIVCASFSCPKLINKAFVSKNLDAQLTAATRGFIADTKRNSISENAIQVSKIFQWFSKDFKQNGGDVVDFINKYSDVKIAKNAKKDVKDYNWALNE